MQITDNQRKLIISALSEVHDKVVLARKKDAEDTSAKWNDFREAKARRMDQERDEIDALLKVLNSTSGTVTW